VLRATAAAGHETGIHCYDHVYWQDNVAERGAEWTRRQFTRAVDAYREAFGTAPRSHCAAGWQANAHLLELEDEFGFAYASDCRGTGPFLPVMDGYAATCPQLPTTLPTLDELVGVDGMDVRGAVDRILDMTATPPPAGAHVYTLHAELEGQQFAGEFMRLVDTWRARGHRIVTMAELRRQLDPARLPRLPMTLGELAGRSGRLALQG
jgi:peptidoglycan/xylan/chitin deacetylase (PgdA/CDA1 family)